MNPWFMEMVMKERVKELLLEADRNRLAYSVQKDKRSQSQNISHRGQIWLGSKLATAGLYLLNRAKPSDFHSGRNQQPEAYPSDAKYFDFNCFSNMDQLAPSRERQN